MNIIWLIAAVLFLYTAIVEFVKGSPWTGLGLLLLSGAFFAATFWKGSGK